MQKFHDLANIQILDDDIDQIYSKFWIIARSATKN